MIFPHSVLEVCNIGDKTLVVYIWDQLSEESDPRVWENVELFDESGEKIWTINGMESCPYFDKNIDTFVGLRTKNNRVQVTSFSGNSYDIDFDTGKINFYEFHK